MPRVKILFYYLVLRNTDRPLAGTSTAMLRATKRLAAVTDEFDILLTGDGVEHPEDFGDGRRMEVLPSRGDRERFLAGFDIVNFASHLGFFDGLPKPPCQTWILHQHCWDLMPDIPVRLADFDAVVALSDTHRDRLVGLGCAQDKVRVIQNFLEPGEFYPPSFPPPPHSLVYCGALVPHKGVHILVEAFRIVAMQVPDATLDIYGAPDMWLDFEPGYDQRLKQAAQGLDIRFHDPVPNRDVPGVLRRYSVLCLSSISETFPLTVLEAQACGVIPVAHDAGGTKAALDSGRTGFLYSPNTPEAMVGAILGAFERIECDLGIRERAAAFVSGNFSGESQTALLIELLAGFASKPSP